MRKRWVSRPDENGKHKLVEVTNGAPSDGGPSHYYIHEDTIPDTWHPLDGKHYNSKSAFRRTTKAHGGREIGGDWFHKDGTINRWAVSSPPKTETIKETLVKALKGEIH